jgi:hypothetical protein
MTNYTPYEERELHAAAAAIARGYQDAAALRELLIWTTSKTTCARVEEYLKPHLGEANLVCSLVVIALEGEDSGDAPWAAANLLAEAPAGALRPHEAALAELSAHSWSYLSVPARMALAKVRQ